MKKLLDNQESLWYCKDMKKITCIQIDNQWSALHTDYSETGYGRTSKESLGDLLMKLPSEVSDCEVTVLGKEGDIFFEKRDIPQDIQDEIIDDYVDHLNFSDLSYSLQDEAYEYMLNELSYDDVPDYIEDIIVDNFLGLATPEDLPSRLIEEIEENYRNRMNAGEEQDG